MSTHLTTNKPSALIQHRLQPLFIQKLGSMYAGINELSQLTVLSNRVVSPELKKLLQDWFVHLEKQRDRFGQIFQLLMVTPATKVDTVTSAMINGLKKIVAVKRGKGTDAAVLIELLRIIYDNAATCQVLEQLASSLRMEASVNILHQALEDEKDWQPILEDISSRLMHEEPLVSF
jgi:ferritin-like metal-binding protein YciE